MSVFLIVVISCLIVSLLVIGTFYRINLTLKKSSLSDQQLEQMTRLELSNNKPLLMTRAFLYILVRITYSDICRKNDLTIVELTDILINDNCESISTDGTTPNNTIP